MDHNEFCCIFDASQYTGVPDASSCPQVLNIPALVKKLDSMYAAGHEAEATALLEQARTDACSAGDWRSELSVLSELLGHYRRTLEKDKALNTVRDALDIIRRHHLGQTVSGATVMLNAATTLKAFGLAADSVPIFTHVARVFSDNLDPADYRFAGLYNNMALSYDDIGDLESAERFFHLAVRRIRQTAQPENDLAVTYCNMADMYGKRDPEDPRIEEYLEKAWASLNAPALPHDGYHAFTISKCAPTFDYFGFFLYAKELRARAEEIYAGN